MRRHRSLNTPTNRRSIVVLLVVGLVVAACGHRTDTADLIAANSQTLESSQTEQSTQTTDPDAVGRTPTRETSGTVAPGSSGSDASTGTGDASAPGAEAGDPAQSGGDAQSGSVGTPGETGPIVIGSVGNYSGIAGPSQAPMARAVQVWADYINSQGGLFGREVRVVVVDDRGDPSQHVAALRDLVENRKAVAFVANAAALTIASGRSYLESVGVPVLGTACANTTEFESPIMFPQCESTPDYFLDTLRAGVEFGGTNNNIAFLTCSEAQTCTDAHNHVVGENMAQKAGGKLVYSARASLAQPDFTSECRAAQSAGAELMNVVLDPTGVIRVGQSCARQGYNPTFVQGSATLFQESKDQPGLGKLIVTSQVFPFVGNGTPARKEFQDVMASFYGEAPGPAEAYGWAAAKLFQEAATRAARDAQSISPKTLVDAVNTFDRETLGGLTIPLTFPPGQPAEPPPCVFALKAEDGKWTLLNNGEPLCR